MTVIVRGKIRNNAWVDEQVIFRGAAELYSPANFHYGSQVHVRSSRVISSTRSATRASPRAPRICRSPTRQGPPRQRRWIGAQGQPVREDARRGRVNLDLRAPQPAGLRVRSGDEQAVGDRARPDRRRRAEPASSRARTTAGRSSRTACSRASPSPSRPGWSRPKAYWTPTLAPAGIVFYRGTRYPGWKNSLFVTGLGGQQLRRIEITKDAVTRQEVIFNEYGRVRDIIIGPDGYLYVAVEPAGTTAVRHHGRRDRAHAASVGGADRRRGHSTGTVTVECPGERRRNADISVALPRFAACVRLCCAPRDREISAGPQRDSE